MKSKKLILLTSEFPFGTGETFLESELPYLAAEFEEIIIVSNDMHNDTSREIPNNCRALRFDLELTRLEKIRSLQGMFSEEFKTEKKYIQNHLGLSLSSGIRNTLLVSLFRGKKIRDKLVEINGSSDFSNIVCYSYWCDDNAMGLALLRKQFPDVKTVSRTHGWDLYFEATEFNYLPYRKYIAQGLSELLPISQKGYEYVENRWGARLHSMRIQRLGSMGGIQTASGAKLKLVSCSNIIPLKRVDLIASALAKIESIELEWYHFGEGIELKKLESIVEGIPSNVKVHLLGRKTNSEILEWYKQNGPNLFLNVSTTEGIPVSIMETMSFGTPVLATDVGGTSEIVNAQNGELLPAELTPELLANRIKAFFESSEKVQAERRVAAFETWSSSYNAEKNYSKFAKELAS